ncbi:hypothetical protein J1605_012114 [Eschrichtius robustus]|uniref:Uncharacterized protein n=1 Tax=Eschrichtius robustus TaxID=9764 RepID=A0AB34GMH3_ESCRO|nr:hypothetical protein J1605_012114 [Eschrichtius robustus]
MQGTRVRSLAREDSHMLQSGWVRVPQLLSLRCRARALQQERPRHKITLVVQWLRIHLPVQGTRVRSLVPEDPTCHGATKPMRHNYRACALEYAHRNY